MRFVIDGRFPGLNEYTSVNRGDWRHAARDKKRQTERVRACCIGLPPLKGKPPYDVRITWFERDRRRDVDNIQFAAKYILDGMVDAGVLPDDSQRYVRSIEHRVKVDARFPHVVVEVLDG